MAKLMEPITTDVKLRRLVVNMIYVGVVGQLLGIEMPEIERALQAQLGTQAQGARAQPGRGARRRGVGGRQPEEDRSVPRRAAQPDRAAAS